MRLSTIGACLAVLTFGMGSNAVLAFPRSQEAGKFLAGPVIHAVALFCNASRCIDPDTGAYTYSACDRRGCRPTSGIVGYTDPGDLRAYYGRRGERPGYRDRRYYEDEPTYGRGPQWRYNQFYNEY
jgi:hypothetical protein